MKDDWDIKWEGFEDVKRALEQFEEESIEAITVATNDCGEDLLAKAQKLAPKLTGDLEGTGTRQGVEINQPVEIDSLAGIISKEVGFNTEYAARMHEDVYNPGPYTQSKPSVDGMTPGRKYLERPLRYYMPQWMQYIADAMRR